MHGSSQFAYDTHMRDLNNAGAMIKQAKRELEENPTKRVEVVLEGGGRLVGDWMEGSGQDTAILYTDTGATVGSITIHLAKVVGIGAFIDAHQSTEVKGMLVSPRMRDMTIASAVAQVLTRQDEAITVDMLDQLARLTKDEDLVFAISAITNPALTSESLERLESLPIDLIDPRYSDIVHRTLLANLSSPMAIDDIFAEVDEAPSLPSLLAIAIEVTNGKAFIRENAAEIAKWPAILMEGDADGNQDVKARLRLGYIIREARRVYRPFMVREHLLMEVRNLMRSWS